MWVVWLSHISIFSNVIYIIMYLYVSSLQLVRYVAECKHQSRPCRITAILVFSVIWNLIKTDQVRETTL